MERKNDEIFWQLSAVHDARNDRNSTKRYPNTSNVNSMIMAGQSKDIDTIELRQALSIHDETPSEIKIVYQRQTKRKL